MVLPLRQLSVGGRAQRAAWLERKRQGPSPLVYQPTLVETPRERPITDTLRVFNETD